MTCCDVEQLIKEKFNWNDRTYVKEKNTGAEDVMMKSDNR